MKKLGFTLTEVLLSMAIIGVVASITAPSLMNLIPNKDKIQTLKYYKLITDINANLLNDRSIYVDGVFDNVPPLNENYNSDLLSVTDNYNMETNKYGFFLMENLEVEEFISINGTYTYFKTIDGYEWKVRTDYYRIPVEITIDKDGFNIGKNSFGSLDNKNPDQFKFAIDPTTGEAIGHDDDKITAQYLKHKNRLGNKKNDYICAFTPNSNDCDDDL